MNWLKQLFRGVKVSSPSPPVASKRGAVEIASRASMEERFGNLRVPAIHLRPVDETLFSKLGGLPQLPPGFAWPEWNGKPQAFLAQIDLAEVHAALPSFLPAHGLLYFFYDQEQSVWGFDPKDRGGWKVIYTEANATGLPECAAPAGLDPKYHVYADQPVVPHRIDVLPDSQRLPRSTFAWDRDGEAYTELREAAFEGIRHHQMLGFPTPVQNDDMELECQLASNGVYLGKPEGHRDPRRAELEPGASEWKLLLQLDSDDDTGWMWGDVGTIFYWIRESDARRGDFSNVWFSFQCC